MQSIGYFCSMDGQFATVAVFTYSSEANIIKGLLESEGIPVYISDGITIDTDPLVSQAIGGVKLKVAVEDEEKAIAVLKSVNPHSLTDEGKQIHCPKCHSTKINFFSNVSDLKSLAAFVFGFLFGSLPFYKRYDYTCEACSTKFANVEETRIAHPSGNH